MTAERGGIAHWYRGVPLSAKWPTLIGLGILVFWLGCFGVWASLAPLNGAVVASGTFVATGQNRMVQHLEGGIIRNLAVKEGDIVEASQVLVRMDDTAAKAKLRRLVLKKYRLLAMKARLEAEMATSDALETPPALATNAGDPDVRAILDRQRTELQARRSSLAAEELVLRKEISGLEESIGGYEAQVQSIYQRMELFAEELKDKDSLLERQLVRKTEVMLLRRAEASLRGDLGEFLGRIADSKERIARANQRIVHLHSAAIKEAVQALRETETESDDVEEQIHAAQDVLERIEVRAPVRGVVVKRHFHTPGGVVAPGAVIMELLPMEEELLIEAQVNPNDISHVGVGQPALARLSALNQRITPMIEATVVYLSADALTEQNPQAKAGQNARKEFYVVRVRLDEADSRKRMEGFRPTPGMPADVYIKTGERTFFQYIMRPILDSFARAFRES
jgi:HlyD family type I secretion membrane fusion protein